jgi:hypothetical protein
MKNIVNKVRQLSIGKKAMALAILPISFTLIPGIYIMVEKDSVNEHFYNLLMNISLASAIIVFVFLIAGLKTESLISPNGYFKLWFDERNKTRFIEYSTNRKYSAEYYQNIMIRHIMKHQDIPDMYFNAISKDIPLNYLMQITLATKDPDEVLKTYETEWLPEQVRDSYSLILQNQN